MVKNVVIFEARGSWNMTKHKSSVYIDSPLLNVIHAGILTANLLKKGKKVIAIPVVDKLVSTLEYNYPRTLRNELIKEYGDPKRAFEKWKDIIPINCMPSKRALQVINSGKIDKNITTELLSHQEQKFVSFKDLSHTDKLYSEISEKLSKMAPLMMSTFDIEFTIHLFDKVLEAYSVSKKNLNVNFLVSPSYGLRDTHDVVHTIERITSYHDIEYAVKRVNSIFFDVLEVQLKSYSKNSFPIFFDVDGYFNSPTRVAIEKRKVRIIPFSRELGRIVPNTYVLRVESFLEELSNRNLISIKYPLALLDILINILNTLTIKRPISNPREEIRNIIQKSLKDSNFSLKDHFSKNIENMKLNDIERIYFVEGEVNSVNVSTGGIMEKILEMLSNKVGSSYIRVVSDLRENVEKLLDNVSLSKLIKMEINKEIKKYKNVYLLEGKDFKPVNISDLT